MAKSKKEKFNQKKGDTQIMIMAGVAIVIIIAIAAYFALGNDNSQQQVTAGAGGKVEEVAINVNVTNDKIQINKADVEGNKIVKFDYEQSKISLKNGQQVALPLMAYVTPSGQIKTAVRMCEPCNGLSFSIIDGKILNCNTCGTQWDLETGQWNGTGSQACGSYPPEVKTSTINGDKLDLNISEIKGWQPRV